MAVITDVFFYCFIVCGRIYVFMSGCAYLWLVEKTREVGTYGHARSSPKTQRILYMYKTHQKQKQTADMIFDAPSVGFLLPIIARAEHETKVVMVLHLFGN